MLNVIESLAPLMFRGLIKQWAANLSEEQLARIALHDPIALEAARRNDQLGAQQFQRALDAMGVGLFARELWGPTVAYMQRGGR